MILDTFLALPFALTVIGAIVLMLLSFFPKITLRNYNMIAVSFLGLAFLLEVFFLNIQIEHTYLYPEIFKKMFIMDSFAVLFDIMFLGGAILTLLINTHYFKSRDYYNGEFFALLLFAVFGMMMLSHANELITAFIALEIASISIYILVGYKQSNIKSSEAMLKYIVLGALAATFFILGASLIYGVVGSTYFGEIYKFIIENPQIDKTMIIVGFMFISVMILFKIGAVPFHSWVVDVYQGAPFPVTMFMAATFKIALFAIFLRIYLVDFEPFHHIFSTIFQIIAILTMVGGSWLAISQTNLKRMLAGSSVVHAGYLLIALSSIGLGASFAAPAIVFYLISYFIGAVGAFGILSYVAADKRKKLTFEDFKGFAQERPYIAAMMTIFMLSLAGFPSTIGFLGKFYIFSSAIEAGHIYLAAVGILIAFISVYYYFKLIALMYFYPSKNNEESFSLNVSGAFIALMAVMTIWGGIGTGLIPILPGADTLIQIAHNAIGELLPKM